MGETIEVFQTKDIDLDQILSEVGGGIRLVVNRKEPLWCDGYLGTLEIDQDETLSLEDLREMFGGRKLSIKVLDSNGKIVTRRTIKFPDEPRKDGQILQPPNQYQKSDSPNNNGRDGMGDELIKILMQTQKESMETQKASMEKMLEMAKANSESVNAMMRERIKDLQSQQTINTNAGAANSLKDSIDLLDALEGIRERLRDDQPNNEINPAHQEIFSMANQFFSSQLEMQRAKFDHQMQINSNNNTAPPLPERQKVVHRSPQSPVLSDAELFQQASSRFRDMNVNEQKKVAQLFFQSLNSGTNDVEDIESPQHMETDEPGEVLSSPEDGLLDVGLDIDPDDLNELRKFNNQGG